MNNICCNNERYFLNKERKDLSYVLHCIDYRFSDFNQNYFFKKNMKPLSFDSSGIAGSSLCLGLEEKDFNKMPDQHVLILKRWRQTVFDHFDISIQLHDIKSIYLLDHENCGAYNVFLGNIFSNLSEKEQHLHLMENAKKVLQNKYPQLKIVKLYFTLKKNITVCA